MSAANITDLPNPLLICAYLRSSVVFPVCAQFRFHPNLIYHCAMEAKSIQETYAPNSICFGCGPANEKGLKIRSFEESDGEYVMEWRAESHHEAFPGMLNGGIIGSLLDCHSNWAAAHYMMKQNGKEKPDCTVTASYNVKLLRPTPSDAEITVRAVVADSTHDRAMVEAALIANDKVCATCEGVFVAVTEGHPAYHRW